MLTGPRELKTETTRKLPHVAQRNKNWGYAQVLVLSMCQASMLDPRNLSHTGRAFPPRRNAPLEASTFLPTVLQPNKANGTNSLFM